MKKDEYFSGKRIRHGVVFSKELRADQVVSLHNSIHGIDPTPRRCMTRRSLYITASTLTAAIFAVIASVAVWLCGATSQQVALIAACVGAVVFVFALTGLSLCGGVK